MEEVEDVEVEEVVAAAADSRRVMALVSVS